jgi:SAM-dependent methyltransferase
MVVSASRGSDLPAAATTGPSALRFSTNVVWHDLECGSYVADLPLWQELARSRSAAQSAQILDVGAGAGRVALDLARAGHSVTALDLDRDLLGALMERAVGMSVETVCADARTFELDRRGFDLCVTPMQTVQLLGGSAGRVAFLRRARAHLRHGGLLACAIVTDLEPFDCAAGDVGPSPESIRVDGVLYISRPTRVCVRGQSVLIERERRIVSPAGDDPDTARSGEHGAIVPAAERNVIELDRVSASELEREAIEAGLRPEPAQQVAPTDEHVSSEVVMLRA